MLGLGALALAASPAEALQSKKKQKKPPPRPVYKGREVVDFPTNTSDALMSGGVNAMAGAIERQVRRLRERCGAEPLLLMTGGAAAKLAPVTDLPFETLDTLIFEGLLLLQSHRLTL